MACETSPSPHTLHSDKIVLSEKTADEKALDKSSVLEGIGSSKLYLPLSKSRLDGVLTAPDSLAFEMANWLLKHEGCDTLAHDSYPVARSALAYCAG